MFDDEQMPLADTSQSSDAWMSVPQRHSSDPFACPCCANVFSEVITAAGIDLAAHGRALHGVAQPVIGSCLVINARIMTMDRGLPEAEAMWVQDGKIRWLGEAADVPTEASSDEVIDCQGKIVLPGFIDPHMHLAPLAMLQKFENIGPFRFDSTDAALDHLRTIAASTAEGEWVLGRQFDPSLQAGPDYLTRDLLDEVTTEHPIFIYNASLHIAYCNSLALEVAGVDQLTTVPEGSELGRFADGSPNGVLKAGPAMALVARHNPGLKKSNLAEACLQTFSHANSLGITMLCDQGTGLFQGVRELDLYQSLRGSNRMPLRFRYALSQAIAERWDEVGVSWGEGDEWVRLTGWKIVSDGSNQGRTGLQREAFLGSADKGIAYITAEDLNAAVEKRLREGWAVCVHANGDAAIDRVLDAFERAQALGLDGGEKRCRIEHCSILHDEQIERMASLGLSPSFLIGHVHYWGRAFIDDVFGLEKASLLDRAGSCAAKGIRWSIHSDDPVTEMNPLRCIENAVTRNMWRSDELLSPEECVDVEAALRAMTIDAAWQCHSDHEVGSLAEDKFADFVVLDQDPHLVERQHIGNIKVLETWVNGQRVFAL